MMLDMKILSGVVLTLGVLVVLAGVGVLIWGSWTAYWHYATLSTGRSAEFANPIPMLVGSGALLAVGGFLSGLGVGLPRRAAATTATTDTPPASTTPR